MIRDKADRTRAILWCIADAKPDMPVREALGYLKACEAELDKKAADMDAAEELAEKAKPPLPPF